IRRQSENSPSQKGISPQSRPATQLHIRSKRGLKNSPIQITVPKTLRHYLNPGILFQTVLTKQRGITIPGERKVTTTHSGLRVACSSNQIPSLMILRKGTFSVHQVRSIGQLTKQIDPEVRRSTLLIQELLDLIAVPDPVIYRSNSMFYLLS